ncbi:DNA damage-regulated autophagy modulator protein 1-like [Dendropsophus ebraccatus]|uniref:DNA damage-regulated autophagy modulator protein 1-like n=1 Tax=Dendropsophus ebraccatus TaxID=150705 RepID=UPI003832212C
MQIRGLAFVPVAWGLWSLWGLYMLVILTVISGHNHKPFISDTGIQSPESVVYTIVFMVLSILGPGVAFLQYKFMLYRSEPAEKSFVIIQRILFVIGWIVSFGTTVNAIFSVRSNPLAHRIGAGIGFVGTAIYNVCQAGLLYRTSYSSRLMCHIRLAAALGTIVILVLFAVGMGSFYSELCTGQCSEIFYLPVLVSEYVGFCGLTLHQLFSYTDFQSLTLTVSRKGITICLREKTEDPKNPA